MTLPKPLLVAVLFAGLPTAATLTAQSPAAPTAPPQRTWVDTSDEELPDGARARLGSQRLRQERTIRGVSFLGGTEFATSVGLDDRIRVWNTQTGALSGVVPVGPGVTNSSASADGRRVVVGSAGGTAWRAEFPEGKLLPVPVPGESFAISGGGTWIAGWNAFAGVLSFGPADGSGELRTFDTGARGVDAAALSTDGARLVALSREVLSRKDVRALVHLWDTVDGELLGKWELPESAGTAVALVPAEDVESVVVALVSGGLAVLRVGADAPVALVRAHSGSVASLAAAPDGSVLTGGTSGDLARWSMAALVTGATEPRWRIGAHRGPIHDIAVSADGTRLASGGDDLYLRLWDTDGTPALSFDRHESGLRALARSPDGSRLATGDWQGRIAVWSAAGGAPQWLGGHLDAVNTLAFLDEGRLASASRNGSLRVWDLVTGAQLAALPLDAAVLDSAVSPDGRTLATARGDGGVDLWSVAPAPGASQHDANDFDDADAPVLERRGRVESGGNIAFSVAFAPDGQHLAVASSVVRLFAMDDETLVWESLVASPVADLAYAPDGARIAAAAADRWVHVLDAGSGEERERQGPHDGRVAAVAFSPDGTALASAGSNDVTLLLWDSDAGASPERLAGHAAPISALLWGPCDGRDTLVSASGDGTALLWGTRP